VSCPIKKIQKLLMLGKAVLHGRDPFYVGKKGTSSKRVWGGVGFDPKFALKEIKEW